MTLLLLNYALSPLSIEIHPRIMKNLTWVPRCAFYSRARTACLHLFASLNMMNCSPINALKLQNFFGVGKHLTPCWEIVPPTIAHTVPGSPIQWMITSATSTTSAELSSLELPLLEKMQQWRNNLRNNPLVQLTTDAKGIKKAIGTLRDLLGGNSTSVGQP